MSAAPKVTVFVPVYNRERYIAQTIESILTQTFTDFELLLLDDGSTDNSVKIMQSYKDPRIRIVCNDENLGIARTRNKGIQLAQGEYLAILDSDDYAYPTRLAEQVAFLARHGDYAAVGSWVSIQQESRSPRKIGVLPVTPDDVRSRLLFHCSLANASVMARTAIVRAYAYREHYIVCSDFDLWARVARSYKLGNLPRFLVCRRMHAGRVTYEKAQLVKAAKRQIFNAQLTDLDVTFSEADLERHFLLLRMKGVGFVPDLTYLEWADAWLRKLQDANLRTAYYSHRAFAQVLGEIWIAVCWQAAASMGLPAWKCFWRSPLSTEAWSSAGKYLALLAFRRPPQEN
jgi:glycosyltransferase involved in cell wall biosynthesis